MDNNKEPRLSDWIGKKIVMRATGLTLNSGIAVLLSVMDKGVIVTGDEIYENRAKTHFVPWASLSKISLMTEQDG